MASAVRKRSGKYDDNEKTKQTRSSKQSVPRHGDAYLFQPIQGFCLTNFFYALRMIIVIYQRIFLGFQSKLSFTHTQSTLDMSIHRREFFCCCCEPRVGYPASSYLQTDASSTYPRNPSSPQSIRERKKNRRECPHPPPFSLQKREQKMRVIHTTPSSPSYGVKPKELLTSFVLFFFFVFFFLFFATSQ